MLRKQKIYEKVKELCEKQIETNEQAIGVSASELVDLLNLKRPNISADLNELADERKLVKIKGKTVMYLPLKNGSAEIEPTVSSIFDKIIGATSSLKGAIQQAKAAIMYPPAGHHTLIVGDTGVGKSMFAESMYLYAKEIGKLDRYKRFVELLHH